MNRLSFGRTDVGRKMSENQDCLSVQDENGVAIVADGMGGHVAGQLAAKICVESLLSFLNDSKKNHDMTWPFATEIFHSLEQNRVNNAIKIGNQSIRAKALSDPSLTGMGTTVCVVESFDKNRKLIVAFVGDSRVYRFRSSALEQISEDHSLVMEQLKRKLISREEAENSPHKNIITRALGTSEDVTPGFEEVDVQDKDIYLLCSDGLTDLVSDSEITVLLSENENSLELAVNALIDAANEKGGKDNISVILTRFFE